MRSWQATAASGQVNLPDLQKMVDEKRLAFTPAVEISFIRLKHQKYIAVAIEGQQSPIFVPDTENAGVGEDG